jgi:hypothetical protein
VKDVDGYDNLTCIRLTLRIEKILKIELSIAGNREAGECGNGKFVKYVLEHLGESGANLWIRP